MGTVIEKAGKSNEGFHDRLFEEVGKWTSGERGKEKDHGSGGQAEFGPSPSGLLSGFCGG